MDSLKQLQDEVLSLKSQRDAIILAHLYQRGEVREIADYTGGSLGLSRRAVRADAPVIRMGVLRGVPGRC